MAYPRISGTSDVWLGPTSTARSKPRKRFGNEQVINNLMGWIVTLSMIHFVVFKQSRGLALAPLLDLEIATFPGCLHCQQPCNQNLSSPNLFTVPSICETWPRHPLLTTLRMNRGDSVILSWLSVFCSWRHLAERLFHCSDLAGVFNDAQLDDANTLSRSSTSHGRPWSSAWFTSFRRKRHQLAGEGSRMDVLTSVSSLHLPLCFSACFGFRIPLPDHLAPIWPFALGWPPSYVTQVSIQQHWQTPSSGNWLCYDIAISTFVKYVFSPKNPRMIVDIE